MDKILSIVFLFEALLFVVSALAGTLTDSDTSIVLIKNCQREVNQSYQQTLGSHYNSCLSSNFILDVQRAMDRSITKETKMSFLGYRFGDRISAETPTNFMGFINTCENVLSHKLSKRIGLITAVDIKYLPLSRAIYEVSSQRIMVREKDFNEIIKSFMAWRDELVVGGIAACDICSIDSIHLTDIQADAVYRQGVLYEGKDCKCTWYAHADIFPDGMRGYVFELKVFATGDFESVIDNEEQAIKRIREKYGYCACKKCKNVMAEKRAQEKERAYQNLRMREGRDKIRTADLFGHRIGQVISDREIIKNIDDPEWGKIYVEFGTSTCYGTNRIDRVLIAKPMDDKSPAELSIMVDRFSHLIQQQLGIKLEGDESSRMWSNGKYQSHQVASVSRGVQVYRSGNVRQQHYSVYVEISDDWVNKEMWHEVDVKFHDDMRAGKSNRKPGIRKTFSNVPLFGGGINDSLSICGGYMLGNTNGSPMSCSPGHYDVGNHEGSFKCRNTHRNVVLMGSWLDFSKSAYRYYTASDGRLFAISVDHFGSEGQPAEVLTGVYNQAMKRLENELGIKFKVVYSNTFKDGTLKSFVSRWSNGKTAISVGITTPSINGEKGDDMSARVSIVFIDEELKSQAKYESCECMRSDGSKDLKQKQPMGLQNSVVRPVKMNRLLYQRRMQRERRCR